ncbi:Bacterial type II and III secretion system protein [Phycisphaerae bacterium RAS1]|nr:Bacterial type II and III secretion system protein [Phycisphaerae bacterium RAS1]
MRQAVRLWTGLALALLLPIGAWAQTETLTKGLQQLERQEYAAARETLGSVDRSKLNDAEKGELEEALKTLDAAQAKGGEAAPRAEAAPAEHPERQTPVDEMRLRDDLIWQRAVARMQDLAGRARQAVAAGSYIEARTLAEQALQQVEAARSYAEPVKRYEDARDSAINLRREVEDAASRSEADAAAREQEEIATAIRTRQQLQDAARKEKVEQLFASAAQLRKEQRFNEAADALRQIVYIDPSNARARELLEVAEDYASYGQQKDWHLDLNFQQRRSLVNADEALIPWDYEVLYPRNWQELVARRSTSGQLVIGQSPEDSELNRKLDEMLSDVSFQEEPLEKVIASLSRGKLNISVDWDDLSSAGIERDRSVSLKVTHLSLRTVLSEVLLQAGGNARLAFVAADGLLRVATKEKLDRDKFVLVYDIRDLLLNIPKFVNANLLDPVQGLNATERQLPVRGGDAAGPGSLFSSAAAAEDAREHDKKAVELVSGVMDIIRTSVEPDSWRESSGGDASMRELNGQLIVYQTSDAHRQVKDLLHQLRETQALQIALEARYLSVTSNFLEEIGVDIDFVFNQGSADFDRATNAAGAVLTDPTTGAPILVPRPISQAGFLPAAPLIGAPLTQNLPLQPFTNAALVPTGTGVSPHFNDMTPIGVGQNSLGLTNPRGLNTQVPGSFAETVGASPALNIAGSFLDNLQVDFLIRATQANRRSSVVQAPRLMMFNGQRANITVGRARTFVSSLFPILAEGAVGFQPILQPAQSGVVLDVEGTISADRKYVTVTVRSSQAEEPSFERFEVQRASGNSPGAFITLLDQRFTTISTTVSIPDGGTVLLGGLKQVGEIEVEAGVPILSKIPVLKRAFTNTTHVKDTRTLLILLKTKIVIQRETEEEAFPTLGAIGG